MEKELESLYRARRPSFCRVAAAIVHDRELAEDVVQDAFATAIRKRRDFRGDGSLEAWVWRIVVNSARDAYRRRRSSSPAIGAPEAISNNGRVAANALPLELLTERQREVLFLRHYADLDYATIATALGMSPGTVGATLSTARATLRRALTQEVSR